MTLSNQPEIVHFIGSLAALNDTKLADGVFRTFCKICYLCWDINAEDFKFTAPGTYRELSRLLKMDRKKAWRHITKLNTTSHIELRRHTDSVFQIRPNYSGAPRLRDSGRANVPTTTYDSSFKEVNIKSLNVNKEDEVIKSSRAIATERNDLTSPGQEWRSTVDNDIFAFLTNHSVGDPARTKIALNAAITLDMVKGHIQYSELMDEPINYAVSRMVDMLPNPISDICSLCAHKLPVHQNIMYQEGEGEPYKEGQCPNSPQASAEEQDTSKRINILNIERWNLALEYNEMLSNIEQERVDIMKAQLNDSPIGKAFQEICSLPRFEKDWLELAIYDEDRSMIVIETLDRDSTGELLDLGIDKVIAAMLYERVGESLQVKFAPGPNEFD